MFDKKLKCVSVSVCAFGGGSKRGDTGAIKQVPHSVLLRWKDVKDVV